jgi:hypothetical protein
MLEYGYALRARSYSVMIPVMNIAYGPADKLPFDMGHLRHPLQYQLPATAKNAERRAVRKALTEEFEMTRAGACGSNTVIACRSPPRVTLLAFVPITSRSITARRTDWLPHRICSCRPWRNAPTSFG